MTVMNQGCGTVVDRSQNEHRNSTLVRKSQEIEAQSDFRIAVDIITVGRYNI